MAALARITFILLMPFCADLCAGPLGLEQVPDALKPWVPWVLRDHKELQCPFSYAQASDRECIWPSRLTLDLNAGGGRFESTVRAYASGWSALPGDASHWPTAVRGAEGPLVVMAAGSEPRVWLGPGLHRIAGSFLWNRLPETLTVPRATGLLRVSVGGRELPFPSFKDKGQLWLREPAAAGAVADAENRVELEVFRRIVDERPLRVVTRIGLRVAGVPREAVLTGSSLPGAIPLALDSPLPARVDPDGSLRLQLRPGSWTIDLISRFAGELNGLRLPSAPAPWPGREIWSFDARPSLRLVQLEGPAAVDPRQTNVPGEWQDLPAYRVGAGEALEFRTLRRGDPEPEPDRLALERSLWLDFDGAGYTVTDRISGSMTHNWRLDAEPTLALGRVSLDGQPQSITRLADEGPLGVEVRRGILHLSADGRFDRLRGTLPATGWAQDFQQVRARLNLPPGWRLLATTGVDKASDTWVGRWTLLDLFVVLIASLAAGRLWNAAAGVLMLGGLSLLWQEPGAPQFVWLNLLAAIALMRIVPEGRLAMGVRAYRNLSFAFLVLLAIPFAYHQVLWGLYPQLEQSERQPGVGSRSEAEVTAVVAADEAAPVEANSSRAFGAAKRRYSSAAPPPSPPSVREEIDPGAITQTGPGVPTWQWKAVDLTWSGPVVAGQSLGLVLSSPAMNLFLSLARVALVFVLGARLLGWPGRFRDTGLALFLPLMFGFVPGARADFPPPEMLEQLAKGLLAAPDCLPSCAEVARLRLDIRDATLTQTLEIHAKQRVSLPVPAREGQWVPEAGTLDGMPFDPIGRTPDGGVRVAVEAGRHQLALSGRLPARQQVQLTLPLLPRAVEVRSVGWVVEGVRDDGVPDTQLRLVRTRATDVRDEPTLLATAFEPFVEVSRLLQIGLDWRVQTTVRRLSPSEQPISLEIPLLSGEAVTKAGIRVRDGRVAANLAPGTDSLVWDSILQPVTELTLRAPTAEAWVETWRLDAGPTWHVSASGIAVVHHRDAGGNWLPEWQPWAGEQVTLRLTRPLSAPGNVLTVDDSRIALRPGQRVVDGELALTLRSAQGTQQRLQLPEGAVLLSAAVDGIPQPLRQQERSVVLPVHPGRQEISLNWRIDTGLGSAFRSPEVDLGGPSVNHRIDLDLGQDRWLLLLGGPQWGPAVLYWAMLLVIAALAVGLGRLGGTPLRTGSWLLLLIGLSQIPLLAGVVVVGWLLALARRAQLAPGAVSDRSFNGIQIGLAVLTLLALFTLMGAVRQGLLGYPEMQVAGNGSTASALHWYQDRSPPVPPRALVLSVPLWVYRVAMLAWALWLAAALLDWLRWGWGCFATGGLWRKRRRETAPPQATPPQAHEGDPWLDGNSPPR